MFCFRHINTLSITSVIQTLKLWLVDVDQHEINFGLLSAVDTIYFMSDILLTVELHHFHYYIDIVINLKPNLR